MRLVDTNCLIPSALRGTPPTRIEKIDGYFLTDGGREEASQDPRCNKEAFDRAIQESDEIIFPAHQADEKWFISGEALQACGLGHWQNKATSLRG